MSILSDMHHYYSNSYAVSKNSGNYVYIREVPASDSNIVKCRGLSLPSQVLQSSVCCYCKTVDDNYINIKFRDLDVRPNILGFHNGIDGASVIHISRMSSRERIKGLGGNVLFIDYSTDPRKKSNSTGSGSLFMLKSLSSDSFSESPLKVINNIMSSYYWSRAINRDLALISSRMSVNKRQISIVYKNAVVGSMLADGTIELGIKSKAIINKIAKALKYEVVYG